MKNHSALPTPATGISSASSAAATLSTTPPTVALVLGSGGARGYAHMGVIEVLLERGYRIVAISGCSMGAMVGGLYAAGKLHAFKDWATGLGHIDVLRLLDISLSAPGAIRGEKVFSIVRDMIGDVRIEDLPIAYTAVATDLLGHKEIWFQEGPLHQAIRASVAIPSLLTPVLHNGRVLVDGGLLNPLPIIPTISAHADLIIAVNLSGQEPPPPHWLETEDAAGDLEVRGVADVLASEDEAGEEWLERLRTKAARWFDWDAWRSLSGQVERSGGEGDDDAHPAPQRLRDFGLNVFDVMNLSFETMQSALTQYKLAGYPPDVLINIPKAACKTLDYHKAPELIRLGRIVTEGVLDQLGPALHPWSAGLRNGQR